MSNPPNKLPESGEGHYRSYLLRLWQDASGKCRVLLRDVLSNEPRHFANLESLFAHLEKVRWPSEKDDH